jgi:hypothetical protein
VASPTPVKDQIKQGKRCDLPTHHRRESAPRRVKARRRGEFTSRAHLAGKILEFICACDDKARPFRWSYDGRPLQAA